MRGNEECDDGNTKEGDGCDNFCLIEEDYKCTSESDDSISVCTASGGTECIIGSIYEDFLVSLRCSNRVRLLRS